MTGYSSYQEVPDEHGVQVSGEGAVEEEEGVEGAVPGGQEERGRSGPGEEAHNFNKQLVIAREGRRRIVRTQAIAVSSTVSLLLSSWSRLCSSVSEKGENVEELFCVVEEC